MAFFCPFLKDECDTTCVFYKSISHEGDPDNCALFTAADVIGSLGLDDITLNDHLENIASQISNVDINTGSDQTKSSSINSRLDDVFNILEEIKEKL